MVVPAPGEIHGVEHRFAMSRYRIGIDVGGTFTDLVAIDCHGRITTAKSASTPRDQSIGVFDGLEQLAIALGIDRPAVIVPSNRGGPEIWLSP